MNFLAVIIDGIPKNSANTVLTNALNVGYYAVGLIAVVMIIISGFTMVTSAGEAEAIKKAKNTILYSVIGIIFVLLAFVITNFVIGAFK